MRINSAKFRNTSSGFTLLEYVLTFGLALLLLAQALATFDSSTSSTRSSARQAQVQLLNQAMESYRAWGTRGYAPAAAWSATTAAGVIAELKKPLVNPNGQTVQIMNSTEAIDPVARGLTVSSPTATGIWSAVP